MSAYWNGAATYYRGIVRALAESGHRITFYEPDAYDRQKHRDIEDPPWARVVVYPPTQPGASAALRAARGADMVVKTSGVGVLDDFLEAAVLEARRGSGLVVFWDVDAPATLERVQQNPLDPFRALIPQYDLVLTYGGGDPVVRGYHSLGARACVPIYNALDPHTHHPVEPAAEFMADLNLLANRLPDREARIVEFFFTVARALPARRFCLGGNGWDDYPLPRNVRYAGHVYTRDHNAFNVTPRAVLNVNRESMARNGFSPPTRIFEAAGAGACIITDEWDGIEMFLEPGREVLVASGGAAVAEYLEGLSASRARAIGSGARRRILAEHTYAHRARQLERLLGAAGPIVRPVEMRSVAPRSS